MVGNATGLDGRRRIERESPWRNVNTRRAEISQFQKSFKSPKLDLGNKQKSSL